MSTEEPRTESTPPRSEASPQAIAAAKRLGSPMILRGILGVAFGFVTVFWPRDSSNPLQLKLPTDVVDHLAIAYLVLFALVLVFQAVRSPLNVRTAIFGQAVIAIPAIIFLFLADQPAELRAALSIWALLHGALEFWAYRQLRSQPMASDFFIASGVHVLLGLILVFGDGMEALSILGFTGAATLIAGVMFIIGGYSRLSKGRQAAKRGELPEQIDTPAEATAPEASAASTADSGPASADATGTNTADPDTTDANIADPDTTDPDTTDPDTTDANTAGADTAGANTAGANTAGAAPDATDAKTTDIDSGDGTAPKTEP